MKAARADGIGVRRPLAGEVRREEEPVDPGPPRLRLGDEVGERRLRREPVAEPLQRPGGREHHAHRVPLARARRGRTRARVPPGRTRTRAAPRRRRRTFPARSRAARAGRSRPRPPPRRSRPRPPRPGIPCDTFVTSDRDAGELGRLEHGRQPGGRELERVEHLGRPGAAGDVEQQRPGRVGDVRRPLAGQPQPDVVLRQHDPRDPAVGVRLVPAQPEELRRREPRQRPVAGQRDQPLEPDALLDLGALGPGALVVPEDRRPHDAAGRVERDEAVHLAGEPDPRDLARRRRSAPGARPSTACVARHQSSGSCSDQPARGVESG